MSDLSKYCVHLLGKEGLGPVRDGFPISGVGSGGGGGGGGWSPHNTLGTGAAPT